ncbi:PAS domain S-box protein [Roseateles violae]|uniref:histidine kinase n=1 Tax=Roseateles violae TaxID=3058042 RepID=A0ABT8DY00_9BURK|nr:PAS domain S-box protein [Pelomonas sp. PFR6]MDN3922399.1 PAS domain S-box protein [Pelomonas sp. PFR6]
MTAASILALIAAGLLPLGLLLWFWLRQRAELQRLRQREARLAMALDASEAALWEWHIAEQRMVLSERYFEQLGYPPGDHEATIERWRALLHPDDAERAIGLALEHTRGDEPSQGIYVNEYRMRDAQGRWRWMLARGRVTQRAPDGRPILMVGTHIDIDAMKRQQRKALTLQQRFQNFYSSTPDAVVIARRSDGCFVDVNPSYVAMTGHTREEALGRNGDELGMWEPPEQREQLIARLQSTGQVDSMRMHLRHKDGRVLTGLMSARPMVEDEQQYLLYIFRDISDYEQLRAQADSARAERAAAEAASRAKTEFLSRMSHELRTPLNAVLGFAQLLQGSEGLRAAQRDQVAAIAQAGWNLLNLINDVLDIARIESGEMRLQTGPVALRPLLEEALRQLAGEAQAAGVELRPAVVGAEFEHWLDADAQRLRQALLNVLGNAIRYNRRGGWVRIACRVDRQAGRLLLQIADNGLGMDGEQLAHLFEPFNRLGREREGIVGTGIGLVLSKHLLALMDASLELHSEAGRGTTATLGLRLADAKAAAGALMAQALQQSRPAANAPAGGGAPLSLLYIEDNEVNQILVAEALAGWPGLAVHLAETGGAGLRRATELRPDLILLDMRLPDMDGLQVLRALKADAALGAIAVVALSASAMPDEIAEARAAGALDYWTKPLQLDRFVKDLQRLMLSAGR